jgi:acyl-CoA synthetase (AMP-forming)/AMP-acid ligase II
VEILTAGAAETLQRRIAGGLRTQGVREGDRVAVLLPGSAAVLALSLAALRTAVVPVPLDPGLTPSERAALLDDAAPALVVADQDRLSALLGGREADLADVPLARPMHYTSGTTGRPKGVWSGVLDEPAARALVAEERELWRFDALDRHLVLSPLNHSAPLRFAMGTLLAGGTVLLPGPFSAESALAAIAEHRPTSMFCVPTQLQRLFAAVDGRRHDLPSLASFRLVAHAGAPCPEPLKRRTIDAFPSGAVWEFYGSTEGQVTACPAEEWRSGPAPSGGPAPAGACRSIPTGRSGARCRRTPGSRTGGIRSGPRRRGAGMRSPSATWAAWIATATCTWTAAARI